MAALFLLLGLGMAFIWLFLKRKRKAISQWPSTPGKIISSELVRDKSGDQPWEETARVTYRYSVSGTNITGHRIALGGSGQRNAKAAVAYYRPGNAVDVFYDPQKPASSVLERRMSRNVVVLPITAVMFLIVSVVLLAR